MSTRDLSVLISVVLIVAMLVIPFPPWLLSILIIINISLALIVLLTTMNMQEPPQFSIFPSFFAVIDAVSAFAQCVDDTFDSFSRRRGKGC